MQGTGLNLRGAIQGIFQYPVLVLFAEGRGIAAARSFIESSADVGGLNFSYRKDVRLYYRVSKSGNIRVVSHAVFLITTLV